MADWKDAVSGATGDAAANRARVHGGAETVVGEFVDATREAIGSVLDEQKERAADRVSAIAEAVRRAGQCLDQAATPTIARYLSEAAGGIDAFSDTIRDRSWSELAADTADFARRRPTLFVAGAMALGFLAGRLLSAPASDSTKAAFTPPGPVVSTPELGAMPPGSDGSAAGGFDAAVSGVREVS